eukprot:9377717-Pyramimonas_sp.AAC.1
MVRILRGDHLHIQRQRLPRQQARNVSGRPAVQIRHQADPPRGASGLEHIYRLEGQAGVRLHHVVVDGQVLVEERDV